MSNFLNEYIDNLNQEQQKAATLGNESAIILAAAGSGKTSTLTCRIGYLIENLHIRPSHILAVTFTNKAAKEMTNRLQKMGINTQELWVGTFHGICHRILRYHAEEVGLKKGFYILDAQEQESFFKRLLRANNYDIKSINYKDLLDSINSYKERGMRPNQLNIHSLERKIYELYEENRLKENCVDFGELLLSVYDLFNKNSDILDSYAEKFEHILVDEFQDTNELQYKWLKLLASKHKNVFAVGDDDQSIYSFRGANPKNLDLFKKEFNAKLIKIEKNYRSDANILHAANAVIQNNQNRQGKNLVPTKKANNLIFAYNAFNDEEESSFIAHEIKKLRRNNIQYKNMAILYRTNGQSRSIEKALTAQNIPYIVYGGFRFFDRQEIKHAMAYLRLAHNPLDNMAFLRVVNIPIRSIGDTTVKKLEILAQEKGISLYEAFEFIDKKIQTKIQPFIDVINYLVKACKNQRLPEMVKTIIVDSGLEEMYENDKKEGQERLDNLYELISAAEVFVLENKNAAIEEFLAFSSLETDINSKKRDENADVVKLMTVHASKGLEFQTVFLTGLEESLFPHANSLGDNDSLEEERRLMYVAITRAKERLYISRSEERLLHGSKNRFIKSRFLKEIPMNLMTRIK
jgi:DNA helicase-2/ATP-dependent DNA helicase PcrA